MAQALTRQTEITGGALIAVVAHHTVDNGMQAPGIGVTRIGSTGIIVVAGDGETNAHTIGAVVQLGAGVAIITGPAGVEVEALASLRVTGIEGARIEVVAHWRRPGDAHAVDTPVTLSTGAAIIAGDIEVGNETTCLSVAGSFSAGVPVLAAHGQPDTLPLDTVVPVGALVLIVARGNVGRVQTPQVHVTKVVGAGIVVVTHQRHAFAFRAAAEVKSGARIAIITAPLQHLMSAALEATAGICSAGIAVVAIGRDSQADSAKALVVGCARVAIVATAQRQGVAACPRVWGTGPGCARVPIFAGLGDTDAVAAHTEVAQSAKIAVIAGQTHSRVDTSGLDIAMLLGARISIVAINRRG